MTSTVTKNPILTITAVKFMQDASAFIARRLFPLFMTREQAGNYYVFDRSNMLDVPTNIRRAPGAGYSRSVMKLSDDSYNCIEYGHEEPVDDREKAKYASALDADKAAVNRGSNIITVNWELRVRDLATGSSVPTSSPSTKWNQANSDPIGDFDTVKEVVRKNCGLKANVAAISEATFLVLKEHAKITDKIKYTRGGIVTADMLASLLGFDQLLVAGGIINNAAEGQTLTPSDIWSDDVIVAHVETAPDLQAPNFGRTFAWIGQTGPDGVIVESYRDEPKRSDIHRVRHDVDEKLVGAECGYHLSDVLA